MGTCNNMDESQKRKNVMLSEIIVTQKTYCIILPTWSSRMDIYDGKKVRAVIVWWGSGAEAGKYPRAEAWGNS